jgi:hypothetical protein
LDVSLWRNGFQRQGFEAPVSYYLCAKMVTHISGLFELETIVPSQFFATLPRQAPTKLGEYRLLVAMLKDAIDCFQKHAHARNKWQQRLFAEAQAWITREDGETVSHAEDYVPGFSFEYVCDVLGLDAADLRQRLQQWRTRSCGIGRAADNHAAATSGQPERNP